MQTPRIQRRLTATGFPDKLEGLQIHKCVFANTSESAATGLGRSCSGYSQRITVCGGISELFEVFNVNFCERRRKQIRGFHQSRDCERDSISLSLIKWV